MSEIFNCEGCGRDTKNARTRLCVKCAPSSFRKQLGRTSPEEISDNRYREAVSGRPANSESWHRLADAEYLKEVLGSTR